MKFRKRFLEMPLPVIGLVILLICAGITGLWVCKSGYSVYTDVVFGLLIIAAYALIAYQEDVDSSKVKKERVRGKYEN